MPVVDTPSNGADRRRRAQGLRADELQTALSALDSGLAEWADTYIFGQVWARPGLEHAERMLVAITALAATGHPNQLKNYLHGALQEGIPPRKVHEAIVMLNVYVGFPKTLEALTLWRQVFNSAVRKGVVPADSLGGP